MIVRAYRENVTMLFRMYKELSDKAIAQVGDDELHGKPDPESNSIAAVVQHIAGNLHSRWKDFLVTDGEKPDRDRDSEFEEHPLDRGGLLELWEKGWSTLFAALGSIEDDTLERTITIRNQPLSVLEAMNRSLAHTAYHAGQIVYIAKAIRSSGWKTLSIARGKSREYTPQAGSRTPQGERP
jgi:hypothetical protein